MIVKDHPDCPPGKPWALTTKDGSRVLGCHETKSDAERQERAVEANKHQANSASATESGDSA